jgi:hypothetical protein
MGLTGGLGGLTAPPLAGLVRFCINFRLRSTAPRIGDTGGLVVVRFVWFATICVRATISPQERNGDAFTGDRVGWSDSYRTISTSSRLTQPSVLSNRNRGGPLKIATQPSCAYQAAAHSARANAGPSAAQQ